MSLSLAIAMATAGTALLGYAAWLWHGLRQAAACSRTPEDVARDAAIHRSQRDLETCQAIWPDPPSWRTAEAQHRHDTAKQREEET